MLLMVIGLAALCVIATVALYVEREKVRVLEVEQCRLRIELANLARENMTAWALLRVQEGKPEARS